MATNTKKEKEKSPLRQFKPDRIQEQANRIYALQRKNDVIALILDGKTLQEIRSYLVAKYKISANSATTFIQHARKELKKRQQFELNDLINLHLHRYEEIYKVLKEMKAQIPSVEALKAKERLLQFHREGFHLKVNKGEFQTVMLQNIDNEYDVNRFTVEERNRFEEILNKAKNDGA